MTKSRIFLFLLLAFIAGVALRSFIEIQATPLLFILLLASIVAAVGILRGKKEVIIYGALVAAFAFGIFRFQQVVISPPNLSNFLGKDLVIQGIIWEEPKMGPTSERFKLRVQKINGKEIDQHFFVLVTHGRYPRHGLGDELVISGTLEEPENFSDFDYISFLAKDEIFALLSFR